MRKIEGDACRDLNILNNGLRHRCLRGERLKRQPAWLQRGEESRPDCNRSLGHDRELTGSHSSEYALDMTELVD